MSLFMRVPLPAPEKPDITINKPSINISLLLLFDVLYLLTYLFDFGLKLDGVIAGLKIVGLG